ncbi:MAG TPA: DUF2231 domain-containing protein, partial [Fimbriimonas sp.]
LDMVDMASQGGEMGKAAQTCIGLGILTSVAAAATGATQWYGMRDPALRRVGLTHAAMNSFALGLYGASYLLRKADRKKIGRGLALLGLAVLTYSGYLGGHMVYKRRAGVD